MFVTWILNFQLNLRKIISLEPHMKLKSLVNEVFFKQNLWFLHEKIFQRRRRCCRQNTVEKTTKFCKINIFYL